MADIVGPLFSLRDTLLTLHGRLNHDPQRANRVARLLLRLGQLILNGPAQGSQATVDAIRHITEALAQIDVADTDALDQQLDELDALFDRLES